MATAAPLCNGESAHETLAAGWIVNFKSVRRGVIFSRSPRLQNARFGNFTLRCDEALCLNGVPPYFARASALKTTQSAAAQGETGLDGRRSP